MSSAITRNIKIDVQSDYLERESSPEDHYFVFTYQITISNLGNKTAQLISRHWIITDANNHKEEVRGPGVVGKQPVLEPGQSFTYSSFCPIATPVGSMEGTYQMVEDGGEWFDARIAPFGLAVPGSLN